MGRPPLQTKTNKRTTKTKKDLPLKFVYDRILLSKKPRRQLGLSMGIMTKFVNLIRVTDAFSAVQLRSFRFLISLSWVSWNTTEVVEGGGFGGGRCRWDRVSVSFQNSTFGNTGAYQVLTSDYGVQV